MTTQQSLISIAVPAYNASRTIGEAIDSVLRQTYSYFELIICDDASTDETVAIIQRYADDRIKLLRNAVNSGEGASRDRALTAATGDWITVLDADDAWHPQRLERLLKATNGNQNTIVFDDIMECHSTTHGLIQWKRMRGQYAFGTRSAPMEIGLHQWINSPRMFTKLFFPRTTLQSSHAMHSEHVFGADTYFALKLLKGGARLVYFPEALYLYRITPGSASNNKHRHSLLCEILEEAIDDFADHPRVQVALRRKIAKVRRNAVYQPFLDAFKQRRITLALSLAFRHPWILPVFFWRVIRGVPYHLHRLHHGGLTRESK